jgi:hypothetical protein
VVDDNSVYSRTSGIEVNHDSIISTGGNRSGNQLNGESAASIAGKIAHAVIELNYYWEHRPTARMEPYYIVNGRIGYPDIVDFRPTGTVYWEIKSWFNSGSPQLGRRAQDLYGYASPGSDYDDHDWSFATPLGIDVALHAAQAYSGRTGSLTAGLIWYRWSEDPKKLLATIVLAGTLSLYSATRQAQPKPREPDYPRPFNPPWPVDPEDDLPDPIVPWVA